MRSRHGLCLGAGVLVALSLPPWGWWPLALLGLAALTWATEDVAARQRWWAGVAFGLGMFVPGLWWMTEFHAFGAVLVVLLETAFVAGGVTLAPARRWRAATVPAALVLAEAVRSTVPFGGLPMAGVPLGQVAGPLGATARVGGELLVLAAAAAVGAVAAEAARRRWTTAAAAVGVVVLVGLLSAVAPDGGGAVEQVDVALVQGGGPRGFRAVDTDPAEVFDRHVAASDGVRPGTELVLWPEDVVDVPRPVLRTAEGEELSALADRLDATLVAGVVEDVGADRFANAAVAWDADGEPGDRYEKVRRVPFGEYVPGRSLIDKVADLSVIPRDAVVGRGPGVLRTDAGDLAVVISFEVFFADRARAAVRAGGHVLLVPTNAASFSSSQVPTVELAAARLRALETGRDVLQAAPTGYTAVVDHLGRVRQRSVLGRREVLHDTVSLRRGHTVYSRVGDALVLVPALATVVTAWWRRRRPGT
ncbi:MAG TPA: apolipoprotein N-acyltransferase [Acidimicrobiales bacterium]|nr:apolipoprotein N-acyltransferase [Acidimicrobiales bacterium]